MNENKHFKIKYNILEKYNGNDKEVIIPDGVLEIRPSVFSGCKSMEKIVMPESIIAIGANAFKDCCNLKEIILSENLARISNAAFDGCQSLVEIIIPANTTEIEKNLFVNCGSLKKIVMTDKVKKIDNTAFGGKILICAPIGSYAQKFAVRNHFPFCELKADNKKMTKTQIRNYKNILFHAFLYGETLDSNLWEKRFFDKDEFFTIAKTLVWQQAANTFVPTDSGIILSDGTKYELTNEPIAVAHPIEMEKSDISGWQNYFLNHKICQPFMQIWESAYNPDNIYENRYSGAEIPIVYFKNAEKHGIEYIDENFHNSIYLNFGNEFEIEHRALNGNHTLTKDDKFIFGKLKIKRFTRRVNHILSLLDRWTVVGRILKDDVSIIDIIDTFTLAQILQFIDIAIQYKANNVLAMLLEYKNRHFGNINPFKELTLDF